MNARISFDEITPTQLRRGGGPKWSLGDDVIGAQVAEMDFGTAPRVTDALRASIASGRLGYPGSELQASTASATARWYADSYGWAVAPEYVQPVGDVITTLKVAIEHYSTAGSAVIVPTPTYMKFLTVPRAMGRRIIEVPLLEDGGRYAMDLEALAAAFTGGGGILLLCNPFNPTGTVFGRAELLAISEVVAEHDGRVFADEVHAPLVYDDAQHVPYASVSPTSAEHTVTGTSAAKAWNLAGLKCAQVLFSNAADAARWPEIAPVHGHGASTLGLVATTAAYDEGRSWLDDVQHYLDGNRKLLAELVAEHLPGVRYTPPDGTYVGWLDLRALDLGDDVAEFFRHRAGVALTDGRTCGANGRGHARLIFATPRPVLREVVERMGRAVTRSTDVA